MEKTEIHKLLKPIVWDYHIDPYELFEVASGNRKLAAFTQEKALIRMLERLSWYDLINLFGLDRLKELLTKEIISQLRFKELQEKYEFARKVLHRETVSFSGWFGRRNPMNTAADNEYQIGENFMPSFNHGYIQVNLAVALHKLGKFSVVSAVTIEIDGKPYIPDISVYPKRPADFVHDSIQMTELPLLAVEILSPTQGTKEIADKFEIYFKAGIKSCWLVVPFICSITVYSSMKQSKTFSNSVELTDETTGIRLSLQEIFF